MPTPIEIASAITELRVAIQRGERAWDPELAQAVKEIGDEALRLEGAMHSAKTHAQRSEQQAPLRLPQDEEDDE